MGDRLATIDMGRKEGASVPIRGGERVPILHNVACVQAYRRTKWHLDPYPAVWPQWTRVEN